MKSDKTACLGTDGWSNINHEAVVTYTLANPKHSIFYSSVNTQGTGHSGQWIAGDINRVMLECQEDGLQIAGCCTDNTNANKLAWKILEKNYPSKCFFGCTCHGLHLLVKNIVCPTEAVMKSYEEAGLLHPFQDLIDGVANVKNTIKFFHNHQGPKAILSALV